MADQSYPEGVTSMDHIRHDMKMGRFPNQSSVETFLAEREAAQPVEDPLAGIRRELTSIERDIRKSMSAWEPPTTRDVMGELARVVSVLQSLYPEPEQ